MVVCLLAGWFDVVVTKIVKFTMKLQRKKCDCGWLAAKGWKTVLGRFESWTVGQKTMETQRQQKPKNNVQTTAPSQGGVVRVEVSKQSECEENECWPSLSDRYELLGDKVQAMVESSSVRSMLLGGQMGDKGFMVCTLYYVMNLRNDFAKHS